ncbi:MAG: STAS domain-containing protein [Phycisphaeraceae bacterium]|nr:STAS domain-containing protein [Phycisphaeraceae bacterium]
MTSKDSRLMVDHDGEITCIGFLDRNILEESIIQHIGDEIAQIIEQSNNPKVLINFKGVDHLSSAALGALINISNRIRKKGGQLRLSNIDAQIYEVFAITKLNKLFQIHENQEQALASFA